MIGSWRWNAGFGGFGAALTLLFSLGNNPIVTLLLRSFYAFVAFALLAFVVRFVLGLLLLPSANSQADELPEEEPGAVLDLVTPDEDGDLNRLMKEQWADGKEGPLSGFQPLQPKRLVSLDDPDPEQVVQAIRRLTDE
jgi:hypothetical protein